METAPGRTGPRGIPPATRGSQGSPRLCVRQPARCRSGDAEAPAAFPAPSRPSGIRRRCRPAHRAAAATGPQPVLLPRPPAGTRRPGATHPFRPCVSPPMASRRRTRLPRHGFHADRVIWAARSAPPRRDDRVGDAPDAWHAEAEARQGAIARRRRLLSSLHLAHPRRCGSPPRRRLPAGDCRPAAAPRSARSRPARCRPASCRALPPCGG